MHTARSNSEPPPLLSSALTPAERLVAAHLVQGLSTKEISTLLGRADATIKNQVGSILAKTGVPTRTRFIAQYYQQFFCVLSPAPAFGEPEAAPVIAAAGSHTCEGRLRRLQAGAF